MTKHLATLDAGELRDLDALLQHSDYMLYDAMTDPEAALPAAVAPDSPLLARLRDHAMRNVTGYEVRHYKDNQLGTMREQYAEGGSHAITGGHKALDDWSRKVSK
jgi:hypothetical protein